MINPKEALGVAAEIIKTDVKPTSKPKQFQHPKIELPQVDLPKVEVAKPKTRGILIMAMGHPYNGKWAFNLALSIRHSDKNIPIHLAWAGDAISDLSESQKTLFSSMSQVPQEMYRVEGITKWIRAKVFLYDLSPFDETIYIDVDTIWLNKKPISQLFNELKDVEFTMINEGYLTLRSEVVNEKYSYWADPNAIITAYGDVPGFDDGKLYMMRSEFAYFKKSGQNRKYFDLVKDIFDNPRVEVQAWASAIPDEFAFNVASCILHHYPHKDNFCPIFWEYLHKKKYAARNDRLEDFYAYSIGGNITRDYQKDVYNNLVNYYYKQAKLFHPFLLMKNRDKRNYLPEREKM